MIDELQSIYLSTDIRVTLVAKIRAATIALKQGDAVARRFLELVARTDRVPTVDRLAAIKALGQQPTANDDSEPDYAGMLQRARVGRRN